MPKAIWGLALATAAILAQTRVPDQPRAPTDRYQIAILCVPLPAATRPPVVVAAGDELQGALDRAVAGDTIVLRAGAVFRPAAPEDSFMLRNRPLGAGQWITIRSSSSVFDADGAVPPDTRVDATNVDEMPHIRATGINSPAVRTDAGAHGYRLIGLDIGADPLSQLTNLVQLGSGTDTSAAALPYDIVIDR